VFFSGGAVFAANVLAIFIIKTPEGWFGLAVVIGENGVTVVSEIVIYQFLIRIPAFPPVF
jgi:hypothetical protein